MDKTGTMLGRCLARTAGAKSDWLFRNVDLHSLIAEATTVQQVGQRRLERRRIEINLLQVNRAEAQRKWEANVQGRQPLKPTGTTVMWRMEG